MDVCQDRMSPVNGGIWCYGVQMRSEAHVGTELEPGLSALAQFRWQVEPNNL